MNTTIEVLQKAAELGLKLGFKPPDKLTVQPIERCPKDFIDVLRAHKCYLLVILQQPFVMVYSRAHEETIFSCEDEATKAMLVEAGAEPFSIYTKDELRILVAHNRTKPLTQDELSKLHEIKRTFDAKITDGK
jgi:hypothetical protein